MFSKLLKPGTLAKTCAVALGAAALPALATTGEAFDLDKLIEAARQEGPITVYAPSGKIVETAQNFTEKYGIEARGRKVSSSAQIEMLIREYRANNIQGDVFITSDASAVVAQLAPMGVGENWVSPQVADYIAEHAKEPLVVYEDPSVWTYNTEVYDSCPVSNLWELTEEEWHRKVAMPDPLNVGAYLDWFNQLEIHHDDKMAAAYEAHYGKPLETDERSATAAWVKAFAQNAPLPTESGSAAGDAVGAPGQTDPFFGFMSTAKYRDNKTGKVSIGICEDLKPFAGWSTPGFGMMSSRTTKPNASRLFLHFVMTEEGISNQTIDGKVSGNTHVPAHPEESSGVQLVFDQILQYTPETGLDDFDNRQDWQDFWRIHFTR